MYICACVCVRECDGCDRVRLQVKLVVIDSIAAHFRHGFECMSLRNRILGGLSQSLILIATRFKLAVSYFVCP